MFEWETIVASCGEHIPFRLKSVEKKTRESRSETRTAQAEPMMLLSNIFPGVTNITRMYWEGLVLVCTGKCTLVTRYSPWKPFRSRKSRDSLAGLLVQRSQPACSNTLQCHACGRAMALSHFPLFVCHPFETNRRMEEQGR